MLLPKPVADGVRDGSVTLAFRWWDAPRVRVGGTQLTSAGVVGFVAVHEVGSGARAVDHLTDDDAHAAGFADVDALRRRLAQPGRGGLRSGRGGDRLFRVTLRWVGEDPRVALREKLPAPAELSELAAAVAKLDAGRRSGPWTRQILEWIRDNPGVVSTELAALLGREVPPMKADIRRLKALGLTISLTVGYRLSPRGEAYLASLP